VNLRRGLVVHCVLEQTRGAAVVTLAHLQAGQSDGGPDRRGLER
jgi:hypothetical protein